MTTITTAEAESQGLKPLTVAYSCPTEEWMMDNVIIDLKRAGMDFAFVSAPEGIEIWKRNPAARP